MNATANEFSNWDRANTVPLLDSASGNEEFDIWYLDTPLLDIDESDTAQLPRRRAHIE